MKDQIVLRVVTKLLVPYIILFGLYVITHGELGPGGGFQGGVIIAAAFILYGLVFGRSELARVLPSKVVDLLAAGGVLLYAGVGFACMFGTHQDGRSGAFLDYHALWPTWPALGLSLVEYGVGLTVAAVMVTIYNEVSERLVDEKEPSAGSTGS